MTTPKTPYDDILEIPLTDEALQNTSLLKAGWLNRHESLEPSVTRLLEAAYEAYDHLPIDDSAGYMLTDAITEVEKALEGSE